LAYIVRESLENKYITKEDLDDRVAMLKNENMGLRGRLATFEAE
jgi:hypothetical protein